MRIIAGIAKGTRLVVPRGTEVRPTSDRVREAIFSSLGERVAGASVLDLFAGSGALGLEALSRGARSVTFVERARQAQDAIVRNLANCLRDRAVGAETKLLRGDVEATLKKLSGAGEQFSLIFADPPYGEQAHRLLMNVALPTVIGEEGVLVLETAKRDALSIAAPWHVNREAVYGDTRVTFLGKQEKSSSAPAKRE